MNYRAFPTNRPQIFYVSREISNCPLSTEFIQFGKKWSNKPGFLDSTCTLSLKFGKRILINSDHIDLQDIKPEDLVEIVDYDPLKNITLVIGKNEPSVETPVHWIVQNARDDINTILELENPGLVEQFSDRYLHELEQFPNDVLERAKVILKTIRSSKHIMIRNKGIILVGIHLQEIERCLTAILEGLNEN